MNPYRRMHADRTAHIELSRRARDYQSELSDTRRRVDISFYAGLVYGLLAGFFLSMLLSAFAAGRLDYWVPKWLL